MCMRRLLLSFIVLVTFGVGAYSSPPDSLSWLRRTVRGFSKIDTSYVEPQHYNFAAMVQLTHTYDIYQLKSSNGQSITLAPSPTMKVGPYFGWRWIFAGYTIDLHNLGGSSTSKQEWDLSIYAAQIGVDLFYRRTGNDYKIRDINLGKEVPSEFTDPLEGLEFDGLSVGITGFNIYYIFNHQRFSYPAAFAQSTCQKISCGSWLAGIGYTRNSLEFDHEKLQRMVERYSMIPSAEIDSGLMFNSVKYLDYSLTGGYAYNWVFARNWLFCASASLGLGYKRVRGDADAERQKWFRFSNINFDGIARLGLVYNNKKWYGGASAVFHGYTYRKPRFSANNAFGNLNIYVGFNFGERSAYKDKK